MQSNAFRPTLFGLESRETPSWWISWWSTLNAPTPSPTPVVVSPPVVSPPVLVSPPVVVSPPVAPPPVAPPVVAPPPVVVAPPAAPSVPALNAGVVSFAQSSVGVSVDPANGSDCYDFAAAALRAAGAKPQWQLGTSGPIANHYAWGTEVYQKSAIGGYANFGSLANVQAGDIIQMEQYYAASPNGSWSSASHHTAVVKSVDAANGTIQVWQQNWNGQKYVTEGQYNLNDMQNGVFTVSRPVA